MPVSVCVAHRRRVRPDVGERPPPVSAPRTPNRLMHLCLLKSITELLTSGRRAMTTMTTTATAVRVVGARWWVWSSASCWWVWSSACSGFCCTREREGELIDPSCAGSVLDFFPEGGFVLYLPLFGVRTRAGFHDETVSYVFIQIVWSLALILTHPRWKSPYPS